MSGRVFSIRPMRAEDRPALLDIVSGIWGGSDYIPGVFDEWVADTRGEFAAVLMDGRLVGCGKLTFFTETDAWLEGLRKDPGVTEPGLGRAVSEYMLARLAARQGLTSVRFSTYVKNHPSVVTNERIGFRLRTALSVKAWQGSRIDLAGQIERAREDRPGQGGDVVTVRDQPAIGAFVEDTRYFEGTEGLIVEGWRAIPYTTARFVERYASGSCRGVLRGGRLAGLAAWVIRGQPGRTTVKLVFLDAADDGVAAALLNDVFSGLAETGNKEAGGTQVFEVEWMLPPGEKYRGWCAANALASHEQEQDFLVYELPLGELRRFGEPGRFAGRAPFGGAS